MTLRGKTIAVTLLATTLVVALVWFGFETQRRILHIETRWHEYNQYATATNHALARINRHFGYGGFIHNFKNYILHQDAELLTHIDANLRDTYQAIEEYRALAHTEKERAALQRLSHVVDIYRSKYAFARRLAAEGNTPRQIEINVQVNDTPALDAIAFLTRHALEQSRQSEQETSSALSQTIAFFNLGALLIPIIGLVAGVVIVFLRRIMRANEQAASARDYAESLVESAPDPWLIVDSAGRIQGTNAQTQTLFGYSREEMIGMEIERLMPPRMRASHVGQRTGFFANLAVRPIEERQGLFAITKDGREFPVEISLSHTRRDGNTLAIAAIRDVTERRQAEQRQRLAQQVFEITAEAIVITDDNKCMVDMNEAFCTLTGYRREELLGQTPAMLRSGRHEPAFYEGLWRALESAGHWQGEIWNRAKDGSAYPSLVTISAVTDNKGKTTHFVATYSDISRLKQNEERLELLAHFDQLTSLPNRMLFQDRLRGARARAHRHGTFMAVMYIDLDGFKVVNDTLGHAVGDQLLAKVAALLRACVREDDTVARLGGDEFTVLFNGLAGTEMIKPLAQRIIDSLSITVDGGAEPLQVSGSAGIAIYPTDAETEERLLKQADQAMYEAKRRNKNGYCFYHELKHNLG